MDGGHNGGMGDRDSMVPEYMITTVDNPYNPFEDFVRWFEWDHIAGYNSWERVARFMSDSNNLTNEEELLDTEKAIDQVVMNDFTNLYRKVDEESAKELVAFRNSKNYKDLSESN